MESGLVTALIVQRDLPDTALGSADVLPCSTSLGVAVQSCLSAWEKPSIVGGWAALWDINVSQDRCAGCHLPLSSPGPGCSYSMFAAPPCCPLGAQNLWEL